MSILHERLPCSQNCFRLKKIYRTKVGNGGLVIRKGSSPIHTLASPSMMKGFKSLNKNLIIKHIAEPMTPTINIKTQKLFGTMDSKRKGSGLN